MRTSLVLVIMVALSGSGFAAEQLVPTKTLLVKNPPSGARKVLWKVKETGSAATVAGDPTADGATLRIQLTNGGDQCVTMPSAGWSAIGTLGFKYKDPPLANGPVKVAMVKKTPSGTLLVKALLKNGGPTPVSVVPGAPTTSYATNFSLGLGDEYCGGTAGATPNPNDAVTFKVSNVGAPAGCVASCNVATSTTLPTCSTPNAACGACGDGVCLRHCASGQLVCLSNATCGEFGCGSDAQCTQPVSGTAVCAGDGADCPTSTLTGCCQGCP
jgi:hypothetical protein